MTESDFEKLLRRYTRGECTDEEKVSIQVWFDKIETNPGFSLSEIEKAITEEKMFADIERKINADKIEKEEEQPFRGQLNSYLIYGGIAASLILAIFMMRSDWTIMNNTLSQKIDRIKIGDNGMIRKANETEKCQLIVLEDSSTVSLKPGSSISYKIPFDNNKRVVTLKGAGFFQITPNNKRPFFVFCEGTVTKVLGTSFWVNTDKKTQSVEVGVQTGKVSVSVNNKNSAEIHSGTQQVFLAPNQRIVFTEEKRRMEKTLVSEPSLLQTPAVAQMKFVYDEMPLSRVMEELGQSYGIEIIIPDKKLGSQTFTGDLRGMTFREKFDLVCESVGTKHNIQGTSISLTGPEFK